MANREVASLTAEDVARLRAEGVGIYCCWRRARHCAESRYPAIQFGYCQIDGGEQANGAKACRVVGFQEVGREPDILWLVDPQSMLSDPNYTSFKPLSVDVTRDGWWRILDDWRWNPDWKYSTAKLMYPSKVT